MKTPGTRPLKLLLLLLLILLLNYLLWLLLRLIKREIKLKECVDREGIVKHQIDWNMIVVEALINGTHEM